VTKVLSPDIDKTALEVLTTGDVLKGTFEFSGGAGPRTITNASTGRRAGERNRFQAAGLVRSQRTAEASTMTK
jgi:hypothetical protein